VPVSSVTAAARLALEGVPKKVATPVPSDVMPVPPLAGTNVPATVIAPDEADEGVKPVVPNVIVVTGVVTALLASSFTVPAEFLKYNFSSAVLIANSPAAKLAANGTADAVAL
jgi:hypothetical protein